MIKYFSLLVFVFIAIFQVEVNNKYEEIDRRSKSVPDSLKTVEEIANYLTNDLETKEQKTRAIHIWIAYNVKYDLNQIANPLEFMSYDEMVDEVLKSRKGICEHYAQLFHAMCRSIDIKSFVVSGYTREIASSEISDISHAWNAVELENGFFFVDNTFAAGYVDEKGVYFHKFRDDYFLVPPEDFIITHIPFDPIWQMLDNPITHLDFERNDFSKIAQDGDFSFLDSIRYHEKLDTVRQIQNRINRIKKFGSTNKLIQQDLRSSKKLIDYHELKLIAERVNTAHTKINEAIDFNNTFIGFLNRGFRNPKVSDEQIESTINDAKKHLKAGQIILKKSLVEIYEHRFYRMDKVVKDENLKYYNYLFDHVLSFTRHAKEIESSIQENTDFSKRYLKTWKPFRFMVPFKKEID